MPAIFAVRLMIVVLGWNKNIVVTEIELISMHSSVCDLHFHFGLPIWKGICSLVFCIEWV